MYKIYLIFIAICFTSNSFSQAFFDNAPCNNGNSNGPNYIDWTQQNFTIYTNALGTTTIQSPFFLSSLNNPNVNEFAKYTNKDFANADGWELWKYDFGSPTNRNDQPYFILYNKHTGLMRIFIAFATLYGQNNSISISMRYGANSLRPAVLENYNDLGARRATENFSNNVSPIVNSNFYLNSVLTWYTTDYYLHYDPCLCNYNSSLLFEVKLSNNGNFNFTLNGQAVQNVDSYGRNGEKANFSSILNSLNTYKPVGVFKDAAAAVNIANTFLTKWLNLPTLIKDKLTSIFTGFSTSIPILGAFSNFLTTIFDPSSNAPVKPMVFEINMKGQGTINYTYNYSYQEKIIPGSEQTLISTSVLPYYNKPVGIFTILTEPIIQYYEDIRFSDEWSPELHEVDQQRVYQLKDQVINYTVNPHAGFDLTQSKIQGQLVYYSSNGETQQTPLFNLGCLKDMIRYFSFYSSYSPDDPNLTYEIGFMPFKVELKIVANFKVANSTLEVPYVGTYTLKSEQVFNPPYTYEDVDPDPNCVTNFNIANSATIKSVCNSQNYKDLASQYFIKPDTLESVKNTNYSLNLYPNPVSQYFTIESSIYFKDGDITKISIYNSYGELVISRKLVISGSKVYMDNLNKLLPGIYFVRMEDRNNEIMKTLKFIKK